MRNRNTSKQATATPHRANTTPHRATTKPHRAVNNERGIALLETAILLPFLVLCSLAIWDVGRIFQSYLLVSEIAREAAHGGARIPSLSGSLTASDFFEHDLNESTSPADMGGHQIIRSRVRLARFLLSDTNPIKLTEIRSRSQCVREANLDLDIDGDGVSEPNGRAVRVQVEGDYHSSFLPGFNTITIRAEEVVNYLGSVPCNA